MPFDPTALLANFDGDKLDALIDTMVLAADADGEIAAEERQQMVSSVQKFAASPALEESVDASRFTDDYIGGLLDNATKQVAAGERGSLITSVKERLPTEDARRAALGVAIFVTAADGIVRTSERELIMELAEALEVDRDEAADMVRDITR